MLFYPQEEEKTKKEVLGWMRQTTLTGEVAPQDPRGRGIPQGCGHFVNSPHFHFQPYVHGQFFVLTTYDRYVDGQILKLGQTKPQNHESVLKRTF